MNRSNTDAGQDVAESTTPIFPNYQEQCVFHACFRHGKTLHEIVEFLNIVHEIVIFQISSAGLMMKADDRPSKRDGVVKDTLFTDLFIPPTGFTSWWYAGQSEDDIEDPKQSTPIPVNAQTLRSNMKGSILAKDSIILYITRDNVDFLHMRIVTLGASVYKVDGATKLLNLDTLPKDILEPLKTPHYDLKAPIVTFSSVGLCSACKDAKTAKVSDLTIVFYKFGIVIKFGNSQGHKEFPHGQVTGVPIYEASFSVKKRFEALAKCGRLGSQVSLFATKGKPILFHFNIQDTGGTLGVYVVPTSEK